MKYYKYQNTKPMSKIWSLFAEMGTLTNDQRNNLYSNIDYPHTLEIVKAALSGSIPLSDEAVKNFNLKAYEYKCRENDKNIGYQRAKEVLNIVEFGNSESDSSVGYGDVSERRLNYTDDSFEEVMNSASFEANIRELYNIRSKYIIEHGVDLVSVLIGSLKGIPEAVSEIKKLVCDNSIKDLIVSLCEDSKDGSLLRVLETTV